MHDLRRPRVAPDDSMDLAVMASFLESGKVIDHASSLVAALSMLAAGFTTLHLPFLLYAYLCITALALVAKYYGWRVALDARLFAVLSQSPHQSIAFDHALATCLGRVAPDLPRAIAERWRGARRLMQVQAVMLGLQFLGGFLIVLKIFSMS